MFLTKISECTCMCICSHRCSLLHHILRVFFHIFPADFLHTVLSIMFWIKSTNQMNCYTRSIVPKVKCKTSDWMRKFHWLVVFLTPISTFATDLGSKSTTRAISATGVISATNPDLVTPSGEALYIFFIFIIDTARTSIGWRLWTGWGVCAKCKSVNNSAIVHVYG